MTAAGPRPGGPPRRFGAAAGLLLLALLPAGPLSAQEAVGPLRRIDEAAESFAAYLVHRFPGPETPLPPAPPFLGPRGERSLLGERLQAALQGLLAARPAGEAERLAGEVRLLPDRVRLLLRLRAPDGSLREGARVDLALDAPLRALLAPPPGAGPPPAPPADPFEPDDGVAAAIGADAIGADAGVRRSVSWSRQLTAGDVDRFRFEALQPLTAILEVSSAFPVRLSLRRGAGRSPVLERTGRFQTALEPGRYSLEVSAAEAGGSGAYELLLSLVEGADDRWEPDGEPAGAGLLEEGRPQERVLRPGDRDWVELRGHGPGFFLLATRGAEADTRLTLIGEEGEELLADDNGGPLRAARLPLFLGPRRVLACVEGADRLTTGRYGLSLERFEPALLLPGAGPAAPGRAGPAVFRLRIERPGGYRVSVPGGPPPAVGILALPGMRGVEPRAPGEFVLERGEYLLRIGPGKAGDGGIIVTGPEGGR